MTVDAVNTDIFDDDKITGVVCVWFVSERLERVRFDSKAIEHVEIPGEAEGIMLEVTGQYHEVLDQMVDALNSSQGEASPPSRVSIRRPRGTKASNRAPRHQSDA